MIFESEVTISRIYRYTYVVRTVLKGHVACKFNHFDASAVLTSFRPRVLNIVTETNILKNLKELILIKIFFEVFPVEISGFMV